MVYWGRIGIGANRGNYYIVNLGYIGIMDKKWRLVLRFCAAAFCPAHTWHVLQAFSLSLDCGTDQWPKPSDYRCQHSYCNCRCNVAATFVLRVMVIAADLPRQLFGCAVAFCLSCFCLLFPSPFLMLVLSPSLLLSISQ